MGTDGAWQQPGRRVAPAAPAELDPIGTSFKDNWTNDLRGSRMQGGDLAVSARPLIMVVLEGVLASITPIMRERRFRTATVTGHNFQWYPTPLKRIATSKLQYPDVAIEVITFIDGVVDDAAEFMQNAQIPIDAIAYHEFRKWTALLPYQGEIRQIIDSDQQRLDQYGQLGRSVARGGDW